MGYILLMASLFLAWLLFVVWVTMRVTDRLNEDARKVKHWIGPRLGARYCATCGCEIVNGHCPWCEGDD